MWQKGDKISWFFSRSFMSLGYRKYFEAQNMEIRSDYDLKIMNTNYPKGQMIPK